MTFLEQAIRELQNRRDKINDAIQVLKACIRLETNGELSAEVYAKETKGSGVSEDVVRLIDKASNGVVTSKTSNRISIKVVAKVLETLPDTFYSYDLREALNLSSFGAYYHLNRLSTIGYVVKLRRGEYMKTEKFKLRVIPVVPKEPSPSLESSQRSVEYNPQVSEKPPFPLAFSVKTPSS